MNSDLLNIDRYTKPTTDAPHELAAAVNLIEKHIAFTEKYDRGYWLRQGVKFANFDHPVDEMTRLLKKMSDLKDWLKFEKGDHLSCGAWLTNRLKEASAGPQPRK